MIKCKRCGTLHSRGGTAKYCTDDCAKQAKIERDAANKEKPKVAVERNRKWTHL